MKSILGALIFLGLTAHAQVWERNLETTDQPIDFQAREFNESDFDNYDWLNEYTNVIVINKAKEGADHQTLRLYVHKVLKLTAAVSTGRENYEKGCGPGQEPKKDHCSSRPYWSTTPTGYFDIEKMDAQYFSRLWQSWMPYAVFFEAGIAMHQAPAGTEGMLGKRASGGCVRLHPNVAPVIFAAVASAGTGLVPKFKRTGILYKTEDGDISRWQSYKTLVIVENIVR